MPNLRTHVPPELIHALSLPKARPTMPEYAGEPRWKRHDRELRVNDLYDSLPKGPYHVDPESGLLIPRIAGGATITPSYTDNVSLLAITTVARNANSRTTFSLNNKWGAFVYIYLGKGGTTALTNGVDVRIRRTVNNGAYYATSPLFAARSDIGAAVTQACAASGNNAGSTTITLNAAATYVAGVYTIPVVVTISDSLSAPTSSTEWAVISRETSTTAKLLDAPSINAHNSTAHSITSGANYWTVWVEGAPGGTTSHELIIDYGDDAAGETVTVYAVMQTFDSIASA